MAINNKGQTLGIAVVFSIAIFIFGILFINFILPEVSTARTNLSCSSTDISSGTKILCLFVDVTLPYYIWAIVSLTGGIIISRFT